ncbi:amino acid adenylation domain-containing protein [Lichenihabitans sp. Uapishka_5]|uniref:Pls/PosA family non-ribosomal peptide synthetase n=1 Tax=Lichenihabitans sp. Uapishka_5 TaxID=3037302 RepID=UPI0029E7F223|nr:Pls/PosA family non-ribosomal peptide synthetase [Lichenihabitans sp. Uapishka_5]MDX7951901.1 amino acid adenylation domain-containing protein [Lichenihabitans sp. Uapishka_5]
MGIQDRVVLDQAETVAPAPEGTGTAGLAILQGPQRPDLLRDELLSEIFDATVAAHGGKVAIRFGERALTYAEVDAAATALARGLVRRGIGPNHVVGLWMPRGADLLIGQIAVAKTGAAWLPFDADAPVDRIAVCLGDAEAAVVLTVDASRTKADGAFPCPALVAADLVDAADLRPLDPRAAGATPAHPAYLIYTSGSTGVPKGIVITGRNICHYLRSANLLYHISSEDVVFQGASVAFDLSMEEIWIPFMVGATLFVASAETLGEVDRLPDLMNHQGITVLDTVPTLLAMLTRDVPSLRLIILGGEACPAALAQRWWQPGRSIFNTYGPTESTVVATAAEVRPDEAVTIGRPIANYTCYVADEALALCGPGVEGELLIGGPGIARGYLKRDALTAEKFIKNPYGGDGRDPVLYRSGDAVVLDAQGNIAFRGRIDDQVKIRGFRVELGEIEAKLSDQPGIAQATAVLRSDDGIDQLVAFLVPVDAASLDPKLLREALKAELPPYMIPARFEIVETLPRLPSGKADRKALKLLPLSQRVVTEAQEEPRSDTEAVLLAAARGVLPPQPMPFDADFFTDLGGHSLLAARFVSAVRLTPRLAGLTLQDMYRARSLRAIAAELDTRNAGGVAAARDLSFTPAPLRRRFFCGLAQAAVLPVILCLMTFQWLGVFISYMLLSGSDATLLEEAAWLVGIYIVINIATVVMAIAAKWILLGRMKPGVYPLWGTYYFRWWLAQRFVALTHGNWFQGSPLMPLFLRSLGAKVGADAQIGGIEVGAADLLTIGDGVSIGSKVNFNNVRVEGASFIVGTIAIGSDTYLGTSCVIENDVVIGDGAELLDLTALSSGTRVGAAEIWDGSPGRKVGTVDLGALPPPAEASRSHRALQGVAYVLAVLLIPPLGLLPIFPAFWAFDQIDAWLAIPEVQRWAYLASLPLLAWPTSFVLVILTVAFVTAIRWIVLPREQEGTYSTFSWFYFRKWVVSLTSDITLDTLGSLSATIYMRIWYRLMGAKIGDDSEISTNLGSRFDLVEIGDKCFIADEVMLGDEDVRRGWMTLKKVVTGSRVFVGNDGVVPTGARIPEGALIGIKSKPPANEMMQVGDTWFGTPPIRLPVRQRFDTGESVWTYEPPRWKKRMRGVIEAIRISLPTMLFIVFGTWAVDVIGPKILDEDYTGAFWTFVAVAVGMAFTMTGITIVAKWLTMGRYGPTTQPMWSWWALRTEAVGVLYFVLAGRLLLDHLRGTPFLPWVLRLFGCHIGKGVYMDMTDITEFDCVTIGDHAAINAVAALQTHLYEDRVMKVGRVNIGTGVTIGGGSTVLYDTHVGDHARLGPLTLVMKGESIPANTEWNGAPAEPKAVVVKAQPQQAAA